MPTPADALSRLLPGWYAEHQRDLPWRRPETTAWGVLVSEIMLQQTPVSRVLGPWQEWLERWPTPAAFAAASTADVLRAWGRLGYPRRALRLHQAAVAIAEQGGDVPGSYAELTELPGIGDYTAAAVSAFAYRYAHGPRHPVLDTNVRRVLGRVLYGREYPTSSATRAERADALGLLPDDDEDAAELSVAIMELGALICTARSPLCEQCPLQAFCTWNQAGRPAYDGPPRRGQAWDGTDRQCRGRILALLRENSQPVARIRLDAAWQDATQLERCVASLVADGLAAEPEPGYLTLP